MPVELIQFYSPKGKIEAQIKVPIKSATSYKKFQYNWLYVVVRKCHFQNGNENTFISIIDVFFFNLFSQYSTGPVHTTLQEYQPRQNSTTAPQPTLLAQSKPPAQLTSLSSPMSPTTTSAPSIPTALWDRSWKSPLATVLHRSPPGHSRWFSWPWPSLS